MIPSALFSFLQAKVSVTATVFFSFSQWSLTRATVFFAGGKGFEVAVWIFPAALHGFNALPLHELGENLKLQL